MVNGRIRTNLAVDTDDTVAVSGSLWSSNMDLAARRLQRTAGGGVHGFDGGGC